MEFILFCNVAYYVALEFMIVRWCSFKNIITHSVINLIFLGTLVYIYLNNTNWFLMGIVSIILLNVSWILIFASTKESCIDK